MPYCTWELTDEHYAKSMCNNSVCFADCDPHMQVLIIAYIYIEFKKEYWIYVAMILINCIVGREWFLD